MDDKNKTPDPSKVDPAKVDDGGKKQDDKGGDTPKTYSQDDLDRVAAKVRSEEKTRADKATAEAIEKALAERDRLNKLSEDEKLQEQRKKDQAERDKSWAEIRTAKNRLAAQTKLIEAKVDSNFIDSTLDLIVTDNEEDTQIRTDNFLKLVDATASARVKAELAGVTLKDPAVTKKDPPKEGKSYF